ncbi:multidrug transporter, putative [Babesia ovata]|uniref:Multidrug transporter, putative n=1 Tax=Babesia ovata TaxID=189622 RepID=A0A2H6K7G7_9APIC|nr:multidrug transporter, putative [Babesia ovata]GBE58941.1 multidrug transporter, putative [Babesia ovata]
MHVYTGEPGCPGAQQRLRGVLVVGVVEAATVTADGDEEGTAVMCQKAEGAGDAEQGIFKHVISFTTRQVMAMRLNAFVYCGVRQPGEPSEDVPDGAGVPGFCGDVQVTDTQVIFEHVVECVQGIQSVMDEAADFSTVAGILVTQLGVDEAIGSNDKATAPEELPQGIVRIYVVMCPLICAAHSELIDGAEQRVSDSQKDHHALGGLGGVRLFRRVEQHAVVEGAVVAADVCPAQLVYQGRETCSQNV